MSTRFWLPTLLWLGYLPCSAQLDLTVARFAHRTWRSQPSWAQALYDFGPWPAFFAAFVALVIFAIRPRIPPNGAQRGAALYLLVFSLGTGALTHLVLKELWSRPRPLQIAEFGGTESFRPIYAPNGPSFMPLRSFPSGHVGCGACFFALFSVGEREKRPLMRRLGALLGFALGGSLALARIAQGGHFLSDTLGTFYVIWCFCLICEGFVYGKLAAGQSQRQTPNS